jgi:hypothetical protein
MATKPIIEIDVDAGAFERFLGLYKEYRASLADMPDAWRELGGLAGDAGKKLAESAGGARDALAIAAAQAGIIAGALTEAVIAQKSLGGATTKSASGMTSFAKAAKSAAREVVSIGSWLLKISALGLGVGAIGSGFGFDALAGAVLMRQRAASSLGLSPGQLASYQVNAQQFLTQNDLAAIAGAQTDASRAGQFATLGIDFARAQREAGTALTFDVLKAAREAWLGAAKGGYSPMQSPAVMAAIALGLSQQTIRNAANTPLSDLLAAQGASTRDAEGLGFDRDTSRAWIGLKVALDRAGITIESGLIRALAPLAPQITRLSQEVVQFIASFLSGKNFAIVVADAKDALKGIGDFFQGDDWKQDIAGVKGLGQAAFNAAKLLGLIPDPNSTVNPPDLPHPNALHRLARTVPFLRTVDDAGIATDRAASAVWNAVSGGAKDLWQFLNAPVVGTASAAEIQRTARSVVAQARNARVDPRLALAAAIHESGLNPTAIGDAGSSFGTYQLHRGGELGQLTPQQAYDAATNARVALAEFARVAQRHPGVSPGTIAALAQRPEYPAAYATDVDALYRRLGGPTKSWKPYFSDLQATLERAMIQHGRSWERYLPHGVRREVEWVVGSSAPQGEATVQRIIRAMQTRRAGQQPTIVVKVHNETAARVTVSANAAAQ